MITLHRTGNNLFTTLAANCGASDDEIVVAASGLDALAVPFYADLGGEIVSVSAVSTDNPAPSQTTWTVTRAVFGAAGNYAAGIPVAQRNYAENINEIQDLVLSMWAATFSTLGGDSGVIRGAVDGSCLVVPGDGVSVVVYEGAAVLHRAPLYVREQTLALSVPISGTTNYQIVLDAAGTASAIEEDAEEPAPSGYLILADVEVADTATEIIEDDLTDRREII
jgi:hypothetical protein